MLLAPVYPIGQIALKRRLFPGATVVEDGLQWADVPGVVGAFAEGTDEGAGSGKGGEAGDTADSAARTDLTFVGEGAAMVGGIDGEGQVVEVIEHRALVAVGIVLHLVENGDVDAVALEHETGTTGGTNFVAKAGDGPGQGIIERLSLSRTEIKTLPLSGRRLPAPSSALRKAS